MALTSREPTTANNCVADENRFHARARSIRTMGGPARWAAGARASVADFAGSLESTSCAKLLVAALGGPFLYI